MLNLPQVVQTEAPPEGAHEHSHWRQTVQMPKLSPVVRSQRLVEVIKK